MDSRLLLRTRTNYRDMLVNAILEFVRENGEECTDYEINEFGLNEGRDGEGNITKVLNFFDNSGCYFYEKAGFNDDTCDDLNEENFYDKLYEGVTYVAYQCLYIVVDENGKERLKYYRYTNGGVKFDEDQAEPDHDFADKLSMTDLDNLISAIGNMK